MPRKKKEVTNKELEQAETQHQQIQEEKVLGISSEVKQEEVPETSEVKAIEETTKNESYEEKIPEPEEEILPDLDRLDFSEFENEEEETPFEPVKTVKDIEKMGLMPFEDFYSMFYQGGFRMLSFVVGYRSVEDFGSKRKMAEVIYRRMSQSPTLKKMLYPQSQTIVDLVIVGEALFEVGGKIRDERKEKLKEKALLKQGVSENVEEQDFRKYVAR